MYEVTESMPAHARIVLQQPDEGWSRAFYDRQIEQYTRDRGAPGSSAFLLMLALDPPPGGGLKRDWAASNVKLKCPSAARGVPVHLSVSEEHPEVGDVRTARLAGSD